MKAKQKNRTIAEVKAEFDERSQQEIDKAVAGEIQTILEKSNRALQPFLISGEMGIIPRVRLVRTSKPAEKVE